MACIVPKHYSKHFTDIDLLSLDYYTIGSISMMISHFTGDIAEA